MKKTEKSLKLIVIEGRHDKIISENWQTGRRKATTGSNQKTNLNMKQAM